MCVCVRARACDALIFVGEFHLSHHGRDGDHFGMFPVFVLGNVLSLPTGILLVSRLGPAVLSKQYALMTAPSCVPWHAISQDLRAKVSFGDTSQY